MMGRSFSLNDYDHQLVRVLMAHGYHSELIGDQHISADPHALGYDVAHEIPDTLVQSVGPAAIEALRSGISATVDGKPWNGPPASTPEGQQTIEARAEKR